MSWLGHPSWRCVLAWGLPAILLGALVLVLILPWAQRLSDLNQRLERTRDQIISYQRILATRPTLEAELEQVRNREDTKAFYFAAATPALAGAELQSEVQEIIRAAGARPVSTQILPVDQNEQPMRIRIRTQFQGTTESVLNVLYRIEAARPFLFVDQLSLRSAASNVPIQEARGRQAKPQVQPRERDELTLRLDVFGYALDAGG